MKTIRLALILGLLFSAACGNDTAGSASATTTTQPTDEPTSGDPVTDSASNTSTPTTSVGQTSATGSTTQEVTTGSGSTGTTEALTSSGTGDPSTGDESTGTGEIPGSTGTDTGVMDDCPNSCPDGFVTRQMIADDMGIACEKLFSPMLCENGNQDDSVLRAEATKVIYWWLEQAGKLGECKDFMPPAYPDVDPMQWYFEFIQSRHCLGLLMGMVNGNFCPASLSCKPWWDELWMKAKLL